jgi:hypothetical protein
MSLSSPKTCIISVHTAGITPAWRNSPHHTLLMNCLEFSLCYMAKMNNLYIHEVMEAQDSQDGCKCFFVLFIVQDKYWNL